MTDYLKMITDKAKALYDTASNTVNDMMNKKKTDESNVNTNVTPGPKTTVKPDDTDDKTPPSSPRP